MIQREQELQKYEKGNYVVNYLKSLLPDVPVFIETGTWKGHCTELAARKFEEVYTIEFVPSIFDEAKKYLIDYENVYQILGDSGKVLEPLIEGIQKDFVIFIDAHLQPGYEHLNHDHIPVLHEIDVINKSKYFKCAIIDDVLNMKTDHGIDIKKKIIELDLLWVYDRKLDMMIVQKENEK